MPTICPRSAYLLLVDVQSSDYIRLAEAAQGMGITVLYATTAQSALGLARQCRPQICMVNSRLPDRCGFELLLSLRHELPEATFFLVGDQYREEDERRVMAIGATLYVCKPVHPSWITACKPRATRTHDDLTVMWDRSGPRGSLTEVRK
jgi:DNA-binding response OmpR family regulator